MFKQYNEKIKNKGIKKFTKLSSDILQLCSLTKEKKNDVNYIDK